jgi:alkanesulfonate monooxygenase SsuD/methylene tetrahydromethanopterin reductase-like flavin-dependent oxidoreductase (luciferase family)
MTAQLSIGLPGTTDHAIVEALSPRIERLGFHALWLNDNPGGDSLEGLRVAAGVTSTLALGSGVIPLDRRPADSLDFDGLPAERLTIGIGSGGPDGGLARVLDALDELASSTDARLVVGALGPRMRRIAAEQADGVLLNWLTPDAAAAAMADLHRDAHEREVTGSLYVRTIVDAGALPVLEHEAARYETNPNYAANFERLGIRAMDATIQQPADLVRYLAVVDEVVLRAITPGGTLAELETFVDTAAGWLGD